MIRLILGAALLWGGGQAFYTVLKNPRPLVIPIERLLAERPGRHWLTITGGRLNLLEATYSCSPFGEAKEATELFLPLQPVEGEAGEPLEILVASRDPALLEAFNRLNRLEDQADILQYVADRREEILQARSVTGLVRFGIDLEEDDVRKLRERNENLAEDFVILDEGARPRWGLSLLVPVGLGLIIWQFQVRRGKR